MKRQRNPEPKKCVRVKRDGGRCGNWAMQGATLCAKHGGKAPQIRRASARKLAIAKAQRFVELSGTDLDPVAHLLDSLYRAWTLVKVWGIMAATIDARAEDELAEGESRGELAYERDHSDSDRDLAVRSKDRLLALTSAGEAKVHPYMVQYEVAIDRHAKIAKLCIDAKIGEWQIQLAERMSEQLSMLFERTVSAIKGLSDEQRLQAATAYANEIAALERPAIDGRANVAA